VLVGPGDAVDVRFTKWGGGRHWEFPVRLLGEDEKGVWCGAPAGTWLERPGAAFNSEFAWVMLFPVDQPWAASYYDSPNQPISVYVDVATPPVWNGSTVTMVDLDLDVVLARDGEVLLDDEDEFDEHQVSLGYPEDVVTMARRTADKLMAAAGEGREPFGSAGRAWLPHVGSAR
jgi:hypothetical protein